VHRALDAELARLALGVGALRPSPTMKSTLGTSRVMRANTCTTSRTRFTARMFDTCMITLRPRGTSHDRAGG
jgi:hypothetical protein